MENGSVGLSRAWGELVHQLRSAIAESLVWWGYLVMPDGPARDEFIVFLADWLKANEARRRCVVERDGR